MATENRILSAVNFIERNLKEPIDTSDIAFECHMSKRTLQRRFVEYTGETIKSYTRARRLTEASKSLINTKMSVLDTAVEYQFDSYEGFSRAFKRMYAMSPKHYRNVGSSLNALDKYRLTEHDINYQLDNEHTLPTIIEIPQKRFAGIRTIQANYALSSKENTGICKYALTQLHELKEDFNHVSSEFEWSVTFRSDKTLNFHFLDKIYAFEVLHTQSLPKEVFSVTVPTNLYAQFHHHPNFSRNELIAKAFNWLKESRFHLGDAPCLYRQFIGIEHPARLYLPISKIPVGRYQWWQGYKSLGTSG